MTSATGAMALLPAPAIAQQATPEARTFNIPAQPLPDALILFGRQAGIEVSAESASTRGRSSPGVSGRMAPAAGLSRLLSGTGLTFRWTSEKSVMVEPAPQASGDGAIRLGPVRVEGMDGNNASGIPASMTSDPAATENTSSYTISVMRTATRLDLSPRETPQSVTVITRQRMDDQGMIDLLDVVRATPGLSVVPYGVGRPNIYSRGFYVDTIAQDGLTSQFDSYVTSPLGNTAVFDRIEVARGATGLARGGGRPSGSINMIRKRPTESLQAGLTASAGSWKDFALEADISGPLTADGAVSGRVVGYIQDADGFRDIEKTKRQTVYTTLDFHLSDTTLFNVGYSYVYSNSNMGWGGLPVTDDGEHFGLPRSTFIGTDWEYLKQDHHTVYASLDQELSDDWKLTVNARYVDGSTRILSTWLMPDEVNGGYGHTYWAVNRDVEQKAIDAFVSGSVDLFGREHELVLGGTVNREETQSESWFDSWSSFVTHVPDPFTWDPRSAGPPPVLDSTSPDYSTTSTDYSQDSLYTTLRLNPADALKVIMGGRLDWYDNRDGGTTTKADGHATLYGAVIYDFHRHHSLYARYGYFPSAKQCGH
ncbi:TonB-dependent siderophore receptor [Altericroceibacterium spongiae]|nr:TonB-dependent receptor [Altericroceibacterium spongiae]